MLRELIDNGYGVEEDFNCAEKILNGANEAYGLGLDKRALKLAAGFGGGMMTERTCGAVAAAVMVLGLLTTETVAHQSDRVKPIVQDYLSKYEVNMASIECAPLKKAYRTEMAGCQAVILKAAEILDEVVTRNALIK